MLAKQILASALAEILAEIGLSLPEKLVIEEPKDAAHGDLSTNAALLLAKKAAQPPKQLAELICRKLPEKCPQILRAESAGPGFCNIFFKPEVWQATVAQVEKDGTHYGQSDLGQGKKVLVEYVSANPTGPLHVGHGRGAALGDSISRLLRAAGYEVSTEYYLNDAGRQMRTLGLSIWLRARELNGEKIDFPADCYKGDYIKELAAELIRQRPDLFKVPEAEAIKICQEYGMTEILAGIKADLTAFGCEHQNYFSENSLLTDGSVEKAFEELEKSAKSFTEDGALWFASSDGGDDKNRVLRKSDGSLTYFASDIAYHKNKFDRGYDWLIDVWGADHHGYIPRMKAAIAAMGENPDNFSVLLVQLVGLTRNGEAIAMSTRAGQFETLASVLQEVGSDPARFMFLSRSSDSPLDFDLELAKKRTMDNPVYYVQYAHARIQALLRRAENQGIDLPNPSPSQWTKGLDSAEDLAILRKIAAFEDVIAAAAQNLAPHYLSAYLMDLAGKIHSYYSKYPVLGAEKSLALGRLAMLRAAGQVLANGLFLLGVSAPEIM